MSFKVVIKGRDRVPCTRLLDALTRASLLSKRITWEDVGDRLILIVEPAAPSAEPQAFKDGGFKVV
jgi:hypothetical protein